MPIILIITLLNEEATCNTILWHNNSRELRWSIQARIEKNFFTNFVNMNK